MLLPRVVESQPLRNLDRGCTRTVSSVCWDTRSGGTSPASACPNSFLLKLVVERLSSAGFSQLRLVSIVCQQQRELLRLLG